MVYYIKLEKIVKEKKLKVKKVIAYIELNSQHKDEKLEFTYYVFSLLQLQVHVLLAALLL